MKKYKIHILYEYGADFRPHGSAFIRLLRPFTHPALQRYIQVSSGTDYENQPVDAVIIDRLWRPGDVSLELVENLVFRIRQAGAKIIYALDDSFHDLPAEHAASNFRQLLPVIDFFLRQADGVIVTTTVLQNRYWDYNPRIVVVPQALDERILVPRKTGKGAHPFPAKKKVIGYMGTLTHDEDLKMVLPALREIWNRHRSEVEFQIVGVIGGDETNHHLSELPIRYMNPGPGESEYPMFMLWFTSQLQWDIAISPLQDTIFNRPKSDIKFLDYCALGAAGVYSRVPAYQSSVRHAQTGWLVENQVEDWIEALETLLQNDNLRQTIAQNAYHYLYSQRILAYQASNWLEALDKILV